MDSVTLINPSTRLLEVNDEGFLSKEVDHLPPINLIRNIEKFREEKVDERKFRFYKSPRLRQYWGDDEEEVEIWEELFYDLIYVAVAFQLGKVLEELIVANEVSGTVIYFVAQFLPLYGLWFTRTLYLSRFITKSFFHGMLDIAHYLLVALMALFIATKDKVNESIDGVQPGEEPTLNFNVSLAFSSCGLLATSLNIVRCLELIFSKPIRIATEVEDDFYKRRKQRNKVVAQGKLDLAKTLISCFFFSLSIIGTVAESVDLFVVPLLLSFFVEVIYHILIKMLWSYFNISTKIIIIPLNVGFVLKRFGEFTMLMLGEGVLQIIITDIDDDNLAGHLQTFMLAFLLLSSLYALAFYALVYEAEESAMSRDDLSSLSISLLMPLIFASIMSFGVCLKLILKNQDILDGSRGLGQIAFANFTTVVVGLIILVRMINHGFYPITKKDVNKKTYKQNVNYPRILFSVFLFSLCFLFEIIRAIERVEGPGVLSIALGFFLIIFLFGYIDNEYFTNEEHEHHEKPNVPISNEVYHKFSGFLSPDSEQLPLTSNRRPELGKCELKDVLSFLRSKTREIDRKATDSLSELSNPDVWEKDVEDIEALTKLIRETLEAHSAGSKNSKI